MREVARALSPRQLWANRVALAYLGLFLAVASWASNTVLARGVVGEIEPFALSFWRWLAALVLILPFSLSHLRRDWGKLLARSGMLALLAFLGVAVYNSALYLSATYTSATNISLVISMTPVITVLLAWPLIGRRPTGRQIVALGLALAGVTVIVLRWPFHGLGGAGLNAGDLIVVSSVLSWGLFTVLLKRNARDIHPLSLLTALIALGVVMILPFYGLELVLTDPAPFQLTHVTIFLFLGLVPSVIGFLCWHHGVSVVGPGISSMFIYLLPVLTAGLATLILEEPIRAHHLLGGALIFIGIYMASAMSNAGNGDWTMRFDTTALAVDIRDMYLLLGRNYTRDVGFADLDRKTISLTEIFGSADRAAQFSYDMDRLRWRREQDGVVPEGDLGFHQAFDFEKDNHAIDQKRYGHGLLVDDIRVEIKRAAGRSLSVVALGIGDGKVTGQYAGALASGDTLIGVDLHADFLARAREAVPSLVAHSPFDLNTLAEGARLDMEDGSADIVECSMVAHHVEDFDALTDEVDRILKPGGRFHYFDLIDKTEREDDMIYTGDHVYPAFHGYEVFRSHTEIREAVTQRFTLVRYVRVGPGMLYLTGEKAGRDG